MICLCGCLFDQWNLVFILHAHFIFHVFALVKFWFTDKNLFWRKDECNLFFHIDITKITLFNIFVQVNH